MTTSGLVLITICFANVLAAQAECCKCDCQITPDVGVVLNQPQLHYLPIPSQGINSQENSKFQQLDQHQLYQGLGTAFVASTGHLAATPFGQTGYQSADGYNVAEAIEESTQVGSKINNAAIGLGHQNIHQQQLHSYSGQDRLEASRSSSTDIFQQPQLSKVSNHQDTHYINIERHVSPQSSVKDINNLDDKEDHHGKNDYYKFEYAVNDQKTHDIKLHKEEKKGDVVQGEYSLLEGDGNVRTVKYYADWKSGFHAQVHNSKKSPLG